MNETETHSTNKTRMVTTMPCIGVEQTPAFAIGKAAFEDGDKCPYPSETGMNLPRYQWWMGWLEARARKMCPNVDWTN